MAVRARTETEAASLALGHVGQPPIGDFATDASLRARSCRLYFAGVRDSLLREKWWSFAKGWATPAASPVESLGPLETRYAMPADCVRVRYIKDVEDEAWDVEGDNLQTWLVTNISAPVVAYTRRITTVAVWDPIFLEGFAYELAANIGRKMGRSSAFADRMHAKSIEKIDSASAIDSKEQSSQSIRRGAPVPSVIAARFGTRNGR